jgi:hypothetical protein
MRAKDGLRLVLNLLTHDDARLQEQALMAIASCAADSGPPPPPFALLAPLALPHLNGPAPTSINDPLHAKLTPPPPVPSKQAISVMGGMKSVAALLSSAEAAVQTAACLAVSRLVYDCAAFPPSSLTGGRCECGGV